MIKNLKKNLTHFVLVFLLLHEENLIDVEEILDNLVVDYVRNTMVLLVTKNCADDNSVSKNTI